MLNKLIRPRLFTGVVNHWWMQRITAVIMIPLVVWFLYVFFSQIFLQKEQLFFEILLDSPIKIVFFLFLLLAAFYHAVLGMQVVFEDYVVQPMLRTFLITSTKIVAIFTYLLFLFSIYFAYQSIS